MGKTRSLVTAAFLAAVLVASKFALDGLPNIELVSLLVIRGLMEYVRKHSFSAFGVYRIILGVVVLVYFALAG